MRQVDLSSRPNEEWLTEPYSTLQQSPKIDEAVLFAENQFIDPPILLFQVSGRPGFEDDFSNSSFIHSIDVTRIDDETFILRVVLPRKGAFGSIEKLFVENEAVLIPPIVYRDGEIRLRIAGPDDAISAVINAYPEQSHHRIERLAPVTGIRTDAVNALSARQREVVDRALDIGYYEHPRQATHADIANSFDCSPSNISVHLQRAEANLMQELFASGTKRRSNDRH